MAIVKIVTFVPETHADIVREAIGNYYHCTFCVKGVERFKPGEGADPLLLL